MHTQTEPRPRPGESLKEELFADYVRSAVRRTLFLHSGMSDTSEIVRTESAMLERAKSRLQEHVRGLGPGFPSEVRNQVVRHMVVVELAGYSDLTDEARARALVDVLKAEGLAPA